MVFSSYLFIFYFLPGALLLYYLAPRRLRHAVLTSLSYVFYGWANPLFVPLLLASTVVDYVCGRVIARERARVVRADAAPGAAVDPTRAAKRALAVSIASNLGLLGFFKYFNFGVESFDALIELAGLPALRLDVAF